MTLLVEERPLPCPFAVRRGQKIAEEKGYKPASTASPASARFFSRPVKRDSQGWRQGSALRHVT